MMNDTPFQPQPPALSDDQDAVNVQSPFIGTMPHPNLTQPQSPSLTPKVTPPSSFSFNTPGNTPVAVPVSSPSDSLSAPIPDSPPPTTFTPVSAGAVQPSPVSAVSSPPTSPLPSTISTQPSVSPIVGQQPGGVPQNPMHSWAGPQISSDQFPQSSFGAAVTPSQTISSPKTLDDLVPTSAPIPDDVAPKVPMAHVADQVKVEPEKEHLVNEPEEQQSNRSDLSQSQDDSTYSSPPLPPANASDISNSPTDVAQDTPSSSTSDAVEGEVIPPAPAKGVQLSNELSAIVEKYQVNQGKPHFPLNTLRLVYLIFAESIASDNQDLVKRRADDILKIIPKVQELFDLRSSHRAEKTDATLETEWQAVQDKLNEIYQIVDTPLIRQSAEFLFSYVFPLQDTLLLSLYEDIAGEKKFGVQDIYSIFHIRSMDSIFYSSLVGGIVSRDTDSAQLPANFQLAINYKLNALYQLNDLVDSIVYAKDDMENKNFSPFELVRKVAEDGTKARELITSMAASFEKRIANFPLSEKTEKLINDFGHQLVGVIGS